MRVFFCRCVSRTACPVQVYSGCTERMNSAEIGSKVSKYENGGNKESLILVLVACEDDLPVTSGDHQIEVCIRMH